MRGYRIASVCPCSSLIRMFLHLLSIFAALAYGIASVGYVRLLSPETRARPATASRMLSGGLVLHALFLLSAEGQNYFRFADAQVTVDRFPFTLCVVSFLVLLIYRGVEFRSGRYGLGAFFAPLGALLMLFSGVVFHLVRDSQPITDTGLLLYLHLFFVLSGDALFICAFCVSVALLYQEWALRKKRSPKVVGQLPSLVSLDSLNRWLLSFGFFAMLVGVFAGVLFSRRVGVQLSGGDLKVVLTLLTLGVYAVVVVGMLSFGLRGRRVAWLSVIGFFPLALSLIGGSLGFGGFHVH